MIRVGFALILASFLSSPVFAETYFVSPTGNDSSGAGTIESPWRTIKEGLKQMSGGDTLYLRGGIYDETGIGNEFWKSGPSPSSPTVVASYSEERAVFRSLSPSAHGLSAVSKSNITLSGWTIDMSQRGTNQSLCNFKWELCNNVTLTNMHIYNNPYGSGVQFAGGSNLWVTSCLFSNFNYIPALQSGRPYYSWRYTNSVVENSIFTAARRGAIQIGTTKPNSEAVGTIIRGNTITNGGGLTYSHGIYLQPGIGVKIYNNLIIGASTSGITLKGKDLDVFNNTIVTGFGAPHGVRVAHTGYTPEKSHVRIMNNIIWGQEKYGIFVESTIAPPIIISTNIFRSALPNEHTTLTGNLSMDPLFESSPDDLRLKQASPARGTGQNLSTMIAPSSHETAPGVIHSWNIGTFEYQKPQAAFVMSLHPQDALILDKSAMRVEQDATETHPADDGDQWIMAPFSNKGWAHFHPTVPSEGDYTIWARVLAPSPNSDSFYIAINGESHEIFHTDFWAPVWQWIRLSSRQVQDRSKLRARYLLKNGVNEISIGGRESKTCLSRLLITNDPEFVPAEVASNLVPIEIRNTKYGRVLKWTSTPGVSYQVLSAESLSLPWNKVGETIIAGGPTTEWLAPSGSTTTAYFWVHPRR